MDQQIADMLSKTVPLAVRSDPVAWHGRSMELIGMDVLLDARGRPYLIEFVLPDVSGYRRSRHHAVLEADIARGVLEIWFDAATTNPRWVELAPEGGL